MTLFTLFYVSLCIVLSIGSRDLTLAGEQLKSFPAPMSAELKTRSDHWLGRGETVFLQLSQRLTLPDRPLERSDVQWFVAHNRGLRSVFTTQFEAAWLKATEMTSEHESRLARHPSEAMTTEPHTRRQRMVQKRAPLRPVLRREIDQKRLADRLESMYVWEDLGDLPRNYRELKSKIKNIDTASDQSTSFA